MKKPSKELTAKWYKKLEKSGFVDIEDVNSDKEFLKKWDSQYFKRRYTPETFYAKQAYYQNAQDVLAEYKFNNAVDKKLYEMHANGLSHADIAKKTGYSKSAVQKVLFRLRREVKGDN